MTGLDEPVDVLLADVRQRFADEMDAAVHPTPGLITLLDRLHRKAMPLAVATSSRRSYAEKLLTHHGLIDRFAFILSAENVTHGKPDPEIYRLAIDRFNVPPGSVLILEDSPAGVAASQGVGRIRGRRPARTQPRRGHGKDRSARPPPRRSSSSGLDRTLRPLVRRSPHRVGID